MRTLAALTPALFAGGCIYVESEGPPLNDPPAVQWADAGCYYAPDIRDNVWYFEAEVTDPEGAGDVVMVTADVYDDRTGAWVDGFELYRTGDARVWFSDWIARTTYLSCSYPHYVVEFVAVDSMGNEDWLSVAPWMQM